MREPKPLHLRKPHFRMPSVESPMPMASGLADQVMCETCGYFAMREWSVCTHCRNPLAPRERQADD